MKKFKLFSMMIAVALVFGLWGMASAGTLDEISKRGVLRVARVERCPYRMPTKG